MRTEEVKSKLLELSRDELNILARKLRIKGYRKSDVPTLIANICESIDIKKLQTALNLTWWDKHKNDVYGWSSLFGFIIAILFFFITNTDTNLTQSNLEPDLILEELEVKADMYHYLWRFQLANPNKGIAIIDKIYFQVLNKKRHPETNHQWDAYGIIPEEKLPTLIISPNNEYFPIIKEGEYAFPSEDITAFELELTADHKDHEGWIYDIQIVVEWHPVGVTESNIKRGNIYRLGWPGMQNPLQFSDTFVVRGGPTVDRSILINCEYPSYAPYIPELEKTSSGRIYKILYQEKRTTYIRRPELKKIIDILASNSESFEDFIELCKTLQEEKKPDIMRIFTNEAACNGFRTFNCNEEVMSGYILTYHRESNGGLVTWMQRNGALSYARGEKTFIDNAGNIEGFIPKARSNIQAFSNTNYGTVTAQMKYIYGDIASIKVHYTNSTQYTFRNKVIVDLDAIDARGNIVVIDSYLFSAADYGGIIHPGFDKEVSVDIDIRGAEVKKVQAKVFGY